jgi:hypothetical protein
MAVEWVKGDTIMEISALNPSELGYCTREKKNGHTLLSKLTYCGLLLVLGDCQADSPRSARNSWRVCILILVFCPRYRLNTVDCHLSVVSFSSASLAFRLGGSGSTLPVTRRQ